MLLNLDRVKLGMCGLDMALEANEPKKKYREREYARPDRARLVLEKDKKVLYSLTLNPSKAYDMFTNINRQAPNPAKITFGSIRYGSTHLEFCTYKNVLRPRKDTVDPNVIDLSKKFTETTPHKWFIFINGEYIGLEIDDWRKCFRIMNKIGNYFGVLGRKKAKTRDKI